MTKTCGECKHHDKYSCLQLKNVVYIASTHLACIRFCPKKPTNGDKIRQGGNRALAAYFREHKCDVCTYAAPIDHAPACLCPDGKTCNDGILAYLNAPTESEVEDEP